MRRTDRLFEIIQLLRSTSRPLTARRIAEDLETSSRTIYRDIAALQSMRVPIEGEAGVGYVMRSGFDLPPLMFSAEETEAIMVGLALVKRTGDVGLQRSALSVGRKIAHVLPTEQVTPIVNGALKVSSWEAIPPSRIDLRSTRDAIRNEEKLQITYCDLEDKRTYREDKRTYRRVWPLAIIYYIELIVLAAWCELHEDFRHFRADRITACSLTGDRFVGQGEAMRARWSGLHTMP